MKKVIVSFLLSLSMILALTAVLDPSPAEASSKMTAEDKVIQEGKKYIGTKYRYGGTTPKGFDCSGFIGFTYKKATGKTLPRTAAQMYKTGKAVTKANLKKGDLVFFSTVKKGASHAGIYIGNNQFIHASSSKGVTITALSNAYWKSRYIGAKRV